jgi:cytochrome bd-type quinol oxidase subunit 2
MAQDHAGEINISRIPVGGIAGLGLVVMAAGVASGLPQMRWLAIASLVGGAAIGLSLIAVRNRRARRGAALGGVILAASVATALLIYFR